MTETLQEICALPRTASFPGELSVPPHHNVLAQENCVSFTRFFAFLLLGTTTAAREGMLRTIRP